MHLQIRKCVYCKAKFKVLKTSEQKWCSLLCLKTHDPQAERSKKKKFPGFNSYKAPAAEVHAEEEIENVAHDEEHEFGS